MKFLTFAVVALSMMTAFTAVRAEACGSESASQKYEGDRTALRAITAKNLTCAAAGVEFDATIEVYALYRCINSPVTASLVTSEGREAIRQVVVANEEYEVTTAKRSLECVLKDR